MPGRMESLLFEATSKFHRSLCMSSKYQTPLHGHNNSVAVQTSVLVLFLDVLFSGLFCLSCLLGWCCLTMLTHPHSLFTSIPDVAGLAFSFIYLIHLGSPLSYIVLLLAKRQREAFSFELRLAASRSLRLLQTYTLPLTTHKHKYNSLNTVCIPFCHPSSLPPSLPPSLFLYTPMGTTPIACNDKAAASSS